MSKLSQEKLSGLLECWRKFMRRDEPSWKFMIWTKLDEQAYQQIKEMIQKPEVMEGDTRDLAIYLQKHFQNELTGETAVEMAIRLLNKSRLQKPEVTEEGIETKKARFCGAIDFIRSGKSK